MTRSKLGRGNGGVVACLTALALCGCGTVEVGSRYVKSEDVKASQGAKLTVSAEESPSLAGASLDIAPNALTQDVRVTLEQLAQPFASQGLSAGPAMVWGPVGTHLDPAAVASLPVVALQADEELSLLVEASDGLRFELSGDALTFSADQRSVAFSLHALAAMQPLKRHRCSVDRDCPELQRCDLNRHVCVADQPSGCPQLCPADTVCDSVLKRCVNTYPQPKPNDAGVTFGQCGTRVCPVDTACDQATLTCVNVFPHPQPNDAGTSPGQCGSRICPADTACDLATLTCVNTYPQPLPTDAGISPWQCGNRICPADTVCDRATLTCVNVFPQPKPNDAGTPPGQCGSRICPVDTVCDQATLTCVNGLPVPPVRDAGTP